MHYLTLGINHALGLGICDRVFVGQLQFFIYIFVIYVQSVKKYYLDYQESYLATACQAQAYGGNVELKLYELRTVFLISCFGCMKKG